MFNQGYLPTSGTFYSHIEVSDRAGGLGSITDLRQSYSLPVPVYTSSPDNRIEVVSNYTFNSAGTYSFRGCIDQESSNNRTGVIAESNENNNCSSWMDLTILPATQQPPVQSIAPSLTASYSGVTSNSATLTGTIINSGSPTTITNRIICYGDDLVDLSEYFQYGISSGGVTCINLSTNFSTTISGLTSNKAYYFKAVATNGLYGSSTTGSFRTGTTTSARSAPLITIGNASNVTSSSVTLSANITSAGSPTTINDRIIC
jgi:hypothetical protein